MTSTEEDAIALKILADVINQKQDELINLQASYAKLGGIFDGDEDASPKARQKLLTGPTRPPKPAGRRGKGEAEEEKAQIQNSASGRARGPRHLHPQWTVH